MRGAWPGHPRTVPNPTPLPLGEGGRRPGEGAPTALPAPFRAAPRGLLALGTLTPTLSQRERGSECGEPGLGTLVPSQIQPLSLWERVAEGRVRAPQQPCLRHSVPHPAGCLLWAPSPQPSPRGRGGRSAGSLAWAPVPNPTPLPLGEGGRRPGEGAPTALPAPFRAAPRGLLALGTLTPTLSQRERGSECGEPGLDTLVPSQIKPLSLWERVAEGRVRAPQQPCLRHSVPHPAGSLLWAPSPQPSPRGRGGRSAGSLAWAPSYRPKSNPSPSGRGWPKAG